MEFVGRKHELDYLDKQYSEKSGSLCIVYGRRRVGKTRLLTHWLDDRSHVGFYWLATDTAAQSLLRSLSRMAYGVINGVADVDPDFTYHNWGVLLSALGQWAKREGITRKVVIILDEFTYAMQAYSDLPHKLQAAWDQQWKDAPIMLVLSGSHLGMMEDEILSARAPLYGRATGLLKLRQLPFKDVRTLFPTYSIESCVALYSILGGVPYYLERIDPTRSIKENMIERILSWTSLIQDESRLLLHDHFRQPRLYAAIIEQVARANHSPKIIADTLDLESGTVNNYLHTLVNLGILRREVPATERYPERSRKSRYVIDDPYLRFYHRFLRSQMSFLMRGAYAAVWRTIEQHWRAFVGTHTFEELCREWVYIAAEMGQLPFLPQRVGSHWSKTEQIDVVAVNWDEGQVLYGECKWRLSSTFGEGDVRKLVTRAEQLDLKTRSGRSMQVHYVLFSRSGFSPAASAAARAVNAYLVDLSTLDATLAQAVR